MIAVLKDDITYLRERVSALQIQVGVLQIAADAACDDDGK
jgi:hypothetical protein